MVYQLVFHCVQVLGGQERAHLGKLVLLRMLPLSHAKRYVQNIPTLDPLHFFLDWLLFVRNNNILNFLNGFFLGEDGPVGVLDCFDIRF